MPHVSGLMSPLALAADARQWYETTTSLDKYHPIFI
jgi:hypothetical protein